MTWHDVRIDLVRVRGRLGNGTHPASERLAQAFLRHLGFHPQGDDVWRVRASDITLLCPKVSASIAMPARRTTWTRPPPPGKNLATP